MLVVIIILLIVLRSGGQANMNEYVADWRVHRCDSCATTDRNSSCDSRCKNIYKNLHRMRSETGKTVKGFPDMPNWMIADNA